MHQVAIIASATSLLFNWDRVVMARANKPLNDDPVLCTAPAILACIFSTFHWLGYMQGISSSDPHYVWGK